MSSKMQEGYLVLADISGYTSFLARTELDHAQEIMSELLELIVKRLQPPLILSKLEGDAVFMYGASRDLPRGEALLEAIEATYVAFRDRLTNMQRSTTCQCAACRAMPSLDLKFMAHHGCYILQSVAGRDEVVGYDVNLAHRLLKNHVGEATGWRAYALFTRACLDAMRVEPNGMHAQTEEYEHLGEIETFSLDLRARYEELVDARRIVVEPEAADVVLRHDFAAPAPVVWDWLTDNEKRSRWGNGHWTAGARPQGRSGPGASNHCAHGAGVSTEEILDWRPFDYFTTISRSASGPQMTYTMTMRLEPIDGGTRLHCTISGKMPVPGFLNRTACNFVFKQMYDMRKMFVQIDGLLAESATATPVPA